VEDIKEIRDAAELKRLELRVSEVYHCILKLY